jgi:hypothetical protein
VFLASYHNTPDNQPGDASSKGRPKMGYRMRGNIQEIIKSPVLPVCGAEQQVKETAKDDSNNKIGQ